MSVSYTHLELDINKILLVLPHRYPFLLVDRITGLVPGKSATGYKNVTINEPFFQGHFPGDVYKRQGRRRTRLRNFGDPGYETMGKSPERQQAMTAIKRR